MSFIDDKETELRHKRALETLNILEITLDLLDMQDLRWQKKYKKLQDDLDKLDKQNLELEKQNETYKGEITMLEQNLRLQKEYNKQVIDTDCMLTIK